MRSQTVFINKNSGFTLVEILVTVAVFGIVLSIGAFANVNLFTREISIQEQTTLVSVLQKARGRAMNNIHSTPHGVHIENGSDYYIIFRGDTYSSSSTTNEKVWREKKVAISGLTDIVFNQLSGNTTNTGTITLVDTAGKTKIVTINANGLIDW